MAIITDIFKFLKFLFMAKSWMTGSYHTTENVDFHFKVIYYFSCTIDWNSFYWKCMSQLYTQMLITDRLICNFCLNIDQVKSCLITCDFPPFGLHIPNIFRETYSIETIIKNYGTKPWKYLETEKNTICRTYKKRQAWFFCVL